MDELYHGCTLQLYSLLVWIMQDSNGYHPPFAGPLQDNTDDTQMHHDGQQAHSGMPLLDHQQPLGQGMDYPERPA
jgi:hypothetical protein